MPKTILIASGKGGTGKTLTSINFSIALNYLDHKVLLIDGNINKPNLGLHLNMSAERSLHTASEKKLRPIDLIQKHPSGIDLILGSPHLEHFDKKDYKSYRDAIKHIKKNLSYYDYIVIDSGPNFSDEFFHSANIADESIIVSETDPISLHEAEKTIQLCDDENASTVGVILNHKRMHLKRADKEQIEIRLKRPIIGVLPHDHHVLKSIEINHPMMCSYPDSPLSKAIMDIGKTYSYWNSK